MKPLKLFVGVGCILLLALLTACERKAAALKEGIVWKLVWSETPGTEHGFYREKAPENPQHLRGGAYNVDMYGFLYPSHLEVRLVRSRDSHSQIIPLSQIRWLEFGDGGVSIEKH